MQRLGRGGTAGSYRCQHRWIDMGNRLQYARTDRSPRSRRIIRLAREKDKSSDNAGYNKQYNTDRYSGPPIRPDAPALVAVCLLRDR